MFYQITTTQLKAHAIKIELINPCDFDVYTLEDISEIAYAHIHSDDSHSEWVKVVDAAAYINQNDIAERLADDKFGFALSNYNKSLQILQKANLIK